jgi:site-specific recombinase XerD
MIEDMTLRNLAASTQDAYLRQVEMFALYFGRSPARLGADQIRQYQLHLVERGVSWSTFDQAVCALRFLYSKTLGGSVSVAAIPFPKRPRALPVVLSAEEVLLFLDALSGSKYRAILTVAYAAGLRVSEITHLRVSDIDAKRSVIRVEQGKGRKDRYVMLSPRLLEVLRDYWRTNRPKGEYLFPGASPERPITRASVASACRQAAKCSGLRKRITPHSLRHAFATHLLEAGTSPLIVQALLGHRHLQTTFRYLHVSRPVSSVASPFDLLPASDKLS